MTEAGKIDVRSEVTAAAGVSVGNVSKVNQLMITAHSDVLQALRSGEIRIHRAWLWSKVSPENQREALRLYRSERGLKETIRTLLSRHQPRRLIGATDVVKVVRQLAALEFSQLSAVSQVVIATPGKAIYVTEGLVESLRTAPGVDTTCTTNNR